MAAAAPCTVPEYVSLPEGIKKFYWLGLTRNEKALEIFLTEILNPNVCVADGDSQQNLRCICDEIEKCRDYQHESSLIGHLVACPGDRDFFLKQLLALGLDPNVENGRGLSATSVALVQGNVECAKSLLLCRSLDDSDCAEAYACFKAIDLRPGVRGLPNSDFETTCAQFE